MGPVGPYIDIKKETRLRGSRKYRQDIALGLAQVAQEGFWTDGTGDAKISQHGLAVV